MNNFVFDIPTKVYFGKDQLSNLSKAAEYGSSVLIVYGGGSIRRNGLLEAAQNILTKAGLTIYELPGVQPNPRITLVREGVSLCRKKQIDMVLAIGGGSSIDSAKLIAAGAKYDGDPWDLMMDSSLIASALPILAVLTLAATGSEMDNSTVITNPETCEKVDIVSPYIIPTLAIMDPTYTFTVSPRQTAAGAVDMFSHILEEYFTREQDATLQLRLCEGAMKTIIEWAGIAVSEPENYAARANLMYASSMALNGVLFFGSEVDWSVHALEHEISAHYDLTHGVGMGILYPAWMRFALSEETAPIFAAYGRNVWNLDAYHEKDDLRVGAEAIEKTAQWIKSLGLPLSLTEAGIDDSKYREMAAACAPLCTDSFVPMTEEDILLIYTMAEQE